LYSRDSFLEVYPLSERSQSALSIQPAREGLPALKISGPYCTGTASALQFAYEREPTLQHEESFLDLAGLIIDGVALSEALLGGDLSEARFRAKLIVSHSMGEHLAGVRLAAAEVLRLLGAPGQPPLPDCALAVLELSGALDDAMGASSNKVCGPASGRTIW